jgi:hypothetical protein
LPGDFVGSFDVGVEGGRFDVGAASGARRVHIDRDQRLCVVNDNGATGRQRDITSVRRLNLMLNLKT